MIHYGVVYNSLFERQKMFMIGYVLFLQNLREPSTHTLFLCGAMYDGWKTDLSVALSEVLELEVNISKCYRGR